MASMKLTCVLLAIVLAIVLFELACAQSTARPGRRARMQARANRANRTRGNNSGRANRGNSTRSRGGRRRSRGPPAGCEEIHLPMCKGLIPYTHTKLPNVFNHTTQLEVYNSLQHEWSYMDHSCSKNVRLMLCAKYLPKCTRRGPGLGPCKKTCMRAKSKCARPLQEQLRLEWRERFSCRGLPARKCVKPMRETRCPAPYPNPNCVANSPLGMCANLSFTWGTMPNMFLQCHYSEINTELGIFDSLVASNCHENLNFLLCGVYSPFCVRGEVPFTFPCRELCEEVRNNCESEYNRLNHNLPWPAKLQCHRLPASTDTNFNCVMPNEGRVFGATGARRVSAEPEVNIGAPPEYPLRPEDNA